MCLSVEFVTVEFLRICRHSCCDWFPGIRGWCPSVLMRLRLKGALRLRSVEDLSTGIEASATGESLNSGDPAVHPAARYRPKKKNGKQKKTHTKKRGLEPRHLESYYCCCCKQYLTQAPMNPLTTQKKNEKKAKIKLKNREERARTRSSGVLLLLTVH